MSLSGTYLRDSAGFTERAAGAVAAPIVRGFLERLGRPPIVVRLWDGTEIVAPGTAARLRLCFRSRSAFVRVLVDPEFQLPERYADGSLEIEGDLVEFFEIALRAGPQRASLRSWLAYRVDSARRILLGISDAASNAGHHYDRARSFYETWLDEGLTYTCAYFASPNHTLEDAQRAKLDRVCRKVGLKPGQHVIEAGSGWGSLALHMARHYGVTVTAYNVSGEQTEYARRRCEREGLADRVTFVRDDYRSIRGRCDAFVSVGMLEHVPTWRYEELGRIVKRTLSPTGLALIHTIGRNRSMAPPRWTRRRIFPGGYMPSLAEMSAVFEPNDLCVLDVENLRLHYGATLAHWLARFDAAKPRVLGMVDERFVRAWRLYLASAAAGFRVGLMQLYQVVFTHAPNNDIPRGRPED